MKTKRRILWPYCLLLLVLASALSLLLGPTPLFAPEQSEAAAILLYVRLPRTLAALFAGAALSTAGAVLQRLFANPLASPGILGVNAGAGAGVTLAAALGITSGIAIGAMAFGVSLLCLLLLFCFSRRSGASKSALVLCGVAAGAVFSAISEILSVASEDVAMLSAEFRLGGFSSVSYARLLPAAVLILLCLTVALVFSRELEVLSLGEDTAQSLGLAVRPWRTLFLLLSAAMAAGAVCFSGTLGFVGLIVPYLMRRVHRGQTCLPCTALFGAAFVCLCDTLARLLFSPFELPVGVLLSLCGAPLFALMVGHRKEAHRA